jgi:hypothetical protein
VEVSGARLLRVAFFLGDEKNELVGFDSSIDRSERCRPADEKRDYDIWKNNDIAEGQNGNTITRLHTLAVAQVVL